MSALSFLGKTAIVTGAGGGIGRAYALELAKRGCRVVVNDVGGTVNGVASATRVDPAGSVVNEILEKGGKAIANRNSVVDGASIVEQALKEFGSCDILINNAGILRDKSFAKMTKSDWDEVLAVHLGGTFALCHAAWPVMQKQNYGRIVNIGSASGLYGNFGQANYGAAKMAIFGLTNTLAKEGQKANIAVNCVVPVAASRMTESLLPPAMLEMLDPKHIVPMVTYLAHESSDHSGECFEVGGGWFSQVRFQRSAGRCLGDKDSPATAEQIAANIGSIGDFTRCSFPSSPADSLRDLVAAKEYEKSPAQSKSETVKSADTTSAAASFANEVALQSDKMFKTLQQLATSDKAKAVELAGKVRARVMFQISDNDNTCTKYWYLDLKVAEQASIQQITKAAAEAAKPNVTLICSDKTFTALASGSLSPEWAYMKGQLKIVGQMGVAMKVKALLDVASSLVK